MRRRARYDPLQSVNEPTWKVVRDKHNRVLECEKLEPLADLRSIMLSDQLRRLKAGWDSEETDLVYCSTVFYRRGDERISVGISRSDPLVVHVDERSTAWSVVTPLKRD